MAAHAGLPELVRDSRLDATFHPNEQTPTKTIHQKYSGRRSFMQEIWTRKKYLGSGGYGVVWLERRECGQLRAVKELRIRKSALKDDDYVRELEALAKFSQDKFVHFFVKSYGWFQSPDALFIAMEYCEHGDLRNYIDSHGRLPEDQAQDIAWQVLQGLLFMHDNGFAHRDLKPANILIKSKPPEEDWHVKICDLGLSKRVGGEIKSTTVKGTPGFMPPEAILPGIYEDPRKLDPFPSDIWCLGETIFHMLTRRATFDLLKLIDYANGELMFPVSALDEVGASEAAIDFVQLLMAPKPRERLTAKEALNNAWMMAVSESPSGSPEAAMLLHEEPSGFSKPHGLDPGNRESSGEWAGAVLQQSLGTLPSVLWTTATHMSRKQEQSEPKFDMARVTTTSIDENPSNSTSSVSLDEPSPSTPLFPERRTLASVAFGITSRTGSTSSQPGAGPAIPTDGANAEMVGVSDEEFHEYMASDSDSSLMPLRFQSALVTDSTPSQVQEFTEVFRLAPNPDGKTWARPDLRPLRERYNYPPSMPITDVSQAPDKGLSVADETLARSPEERMLSVDEDASGTIVHTLPALNSLEEARLPTNGEGTHEQPVPPSKDDAESSTNWAEIIEPYITHRLVIQPSPLSKLGQVYVKQHAGGSRPAGFVPVKVKLPPDKAELPPESGTTKWLMTSKKAMKGLRGRFKVPKNYS